MKFKLKVCNISNEENFWFEEYDENTTDAEQWGKNIIEYFNNTLKSHETARKLLEVIVIDKDSVKNHDWTKTNLSTIIKGNRMSYDTQKCRRCGITGKRFGLSQEVTRDSKYKAEVYRRCDTSKKQLEKLRSR